MPVAKTAMPALPGVDELPANVDLPDVLTMAGGTRITTAAQWPARRAELRRVLEYYAAGVMPPPPGNVRGREITSQLVLDGTVRYRLVHLTFGPDEKLALDIGIFTPAAGGPFSTVIMPGGTPPGATPLVRQPLGPGQGKGVNALLTVGPPPEAKPMPDPPPADAEAVAAHVRHVFTRGYAYVMFNHNDCGEDTTLRNADGSWAFRNTRFFPAYLENDWGLLGAWAWGVLRIVDYLTTDAAIDKTRLIVTGFSRTGKSALIAGAFDERIALTAPVVTGGGGVGAYRFSGAGRGGKEGLGDMLRKYPNWFSPHLRQFWGHVDQLPFDQHWFIALIAPRPFLALEGVDDPVSLLNAVKQSWLGARPAYALFDATDRLGVNYANHGHEFTDEDWTAMLDFADAHLRGRKVDRGFDQFPPDRIVLWNGRDLSGWSVFLADASVDPQSAWSASDGVLRLASTTNGYVRSTEIFSSYHLHLEWRWPPDAPPNSNSGVMVHLNGPDVIWPSSFECQLKTGNAGQVVGMSLDIPDVPFLNNRKRAPRLAESSETRHGDWNTYEIYCRGDTIEVFVNSVRQNSVTNLPVTSGAIALQIEGFPIEFRNVWVERL